MDITTVKVLFLGSIFLACLFDEKTHIKIKIKDNCRYEHMEILIHKKENKMITSFQTVTKGPKIFYHSF